MGGCVCEKEREVILQSCLHGVNPFKQFGNSKIEEVMIHSA